MPTRRITYRRTVRVQVRRTVRVQRTIQVRHQGSVGTNLQRTTAESVRAIPATMNQVPGLVEDGYGPLHENDREFDLFLCHASENKAFVRPLADALTLRGVRVWYDETCLSVGDSLREAIDRGISRSRFGAVIFSREFFAKRWTAYELNGLVTREMRGRKVVLPVWHPDFTIDELIEYSPSMADKRALLASELSIDEVAAQLTELVTGRRG